MSGKNVKKENPSHEHIEQFLTARHYKYKSFLFLQLHVLKWNRVFHINLIKGYTSSMSIKRKLVKVCNQPISALLRGISLHIIDTCYMLAKFFISYRIYSF